MRIPSGRHTLEVTVDIGPLGGIVKAEKKLLIQ